MQDREAVAAMLLNDPSTTFDQGLLDDSYSSINSLDIHLENKATILKKAGSTRRNLPILSMKNQNNNKLVSNSNKQSNEDLLEFNLDVEKANGSFPPVADNSDPHYKSQIMFTGGGAHSSFYTDRGVPQNSQV